MARKFAQQADLLAESVNQLFVAAVRRGIMKGFQAAVENTVQDSSNAAAHWMIGVRGKGNVYGRKFGSLKDLRGKGDAIVGSQGDKRDSTAAASAAVEAIVSRELDTVVNRYVRGQTPALEFFYYNAVASDDKYDKRAGVSDAGTYAVTEAMAQFEREIRLGNTRKRARR